MEDKTSHKQILKSTGIIGIEQAIVVLSGIIRSKFIAIVLGPAGVGIISIYQSMVDFIRNLTGFGLGFSSVRSVAEANATNNSQLISKSICILRRWVWFTGLLGALIVVIFCRQISKYAFGDESKAWQFALLSSTVLLTAVSTGQLALLQGMRRIGYLAKANILSALVALAVSIPLIYLFGNKAIVFILVVVALAGLLFSWFFAAKIDTVPVKLSVRETFAGGLEMARLGLFLVLTGVMSTATMYLVRIWISRKAGLDEVGQFQAAWSISSIYLATVLNGMGADYFPRLSAVNKDNPRINILVNEQAEVALLIAGPLVVGLLCFIKAMVFGFYSLKFGQSVQILQWQIPGSFLRVVIWPIGFVFMAKMKIAFVVLSEFFWNAIYLTIVVGGWRIFGVEGTGIAFLVAYLLYGVANYIAVKITTGFAWNDRNIRLMFIYGGLSILAFFVSRYLHSFLMYGCGVCLVGGAIWISVYYLKGIISIKSVINRFLRN